MDAVSITSLEEPYHMRGSQRFEARSYDGTIVSADARDVVYNRAEGVICLDVEESEYSVEISGNIERFDYASDWYIR
jgi:hypothetical protein